MSAIFVSAASPAMCPCVSLYCLKWSTSASSTENGRPSRRERCASLDSVSMRCRRLYKPVSASVTESRSRSEEHTSELQSQSNLVCRLLLEKKKTKTQHIDAR